MARTHVDEIIAAIDIGTTKICVLIARKLHDESIEVIGIGKSPSEGLHKGVVVDIARTVRSIRAAVSEAELMAGMKITSATIGIAGGHISSVNSHGVIPVKRTDVSATDMENVLAAARAIPVPEGQEILHVLPQYFVIDRREKVHDPRGMHGVRLEVQAHIIMGATAAVQDLVTCCEKAGILVDDVVLEQIASAYAVLSDDEKELGVGVLDIGGGTSDFAVYQNGSIRHTMVLPVAGNHFTNDLAIGLRTTIADAERIKKEYGLACMGALKRNELIEVAKVQGGNARDVVESADIISILEPRAREVLALVRDEVLEHHLHSYIRTGIVLTGGGALLRGMQLLAEDIFDVPIRIGHPRIEFSLPESLDNPMYATSYGLLLHKVNKEHDAHMQSIDAPLVKRVFETMKSWVMDFF
jgi:cell division protein FtsA